MTNDLVKTNAPLARLQGLTVDRVVRSLRFRAMNNLARLDQVRTLSSLGLRAPRRVTSPIFPGADLTAHVDRLKADGISRGLDLSPAVLRELREWLDGAPCFGNHRKDWGHLHSARAEAEQKAGKAFTVGAYFHLTECPAVQGLIHDPVINEIALRYVGPRAKFLHALGWWSFPNEVGASDRNEFAQLYHFDLDDYRFVKFFFYLTDVDEDSGPHVYVRGTHRGKKLRHLYPMRRLSDADVESTYGRDRVLAVSGAAGSGFVVDTFGIHKGMPPASRERLVLQLEFGQHNWIGQATEPPKGELKML